MRVDLKILALITGLAILASDATAQTATGSTATAGETTEASAATEKKASARHKRKTHLNAQRTARREARKEAAAQNPAAQATAGPLTDVAVSFKVDPRLTRSLYMGDRWISAPTFTTTQYVNQVSVEVRAVGRDALGRAAQIAPEWVSADPKIVSVSPARGSVVTVSVHRAGESSLRVVQQLGQGDQVIVKEFAIRAWNQGSALQAEISQKDATANKGVPSKQSGSKQTSLSAPALDLARVASAEENLQADSGK